MFPGGHTRPPGERAPPPRAAKGRCTANQSVFVFAHVFFLRGEGATKSTRGRVRSPGLLNMATNGDNQKLAIHVRGVTKTFGTGEAGTKALKGVDFDARL